MKSRYFKFFFLIAAFILISCGKENNIGLDFGEVHPGQTIEKTLTLNFNDEAIQDPTSFVEFAYFLKDGSAPVGIIFTIDGKAVLGNSLKFYAKDFAKKNNFERKIGIQFPSGAVQQEYSGDFKLINASADLQQYITQGTDKVKSEIGKPVQNGEWHTLYNDPIALWVKLVIALATLLIIGFGTYKFLKRVNGPLGPKSFKNGMISFLDGNTTSVRLEDLTTYNISKALGIEEGIVLEPYDKPSPNGKKRFARLKNTSNATVKIVYDGVEETTGVTQDLYNMDEIKIATEDKKSFLISYANNKIVRI
jgi:hypothetical protein